MGVFSTCKHHDDHYQYYHHQNDVEHQTAAEAKETRYCVEKTTIVNTIPTVASQLTARSRRSHCERPRYHGHNPVPPRAVFCMLGMCSGVKILTVSVPKEQLVINNSLPGVCVCVCVCVCARACVCVCVCVCVSV